ncbi:DUF5995 family protein [Mucilaginibacter jinjuensis]|uniref:DUF5995 family protein n=1 Tax=Mucilaginibacter jinjuensis TaxID=1176721 RepID=A0ABY7T2J7_9SPHI|nr:DUF5995 family protein [Mucilaginibacter jinjuensis]WCT10390.1 DUF5995 family protein [Mucilaginibacter jinjuensis]
MTETTIDDIIQSLQNIIAKCAAANSRLGYFATLYLKVTQSVKDGIASGQFQDGQRMEKLDVVFASRYLDAYQKWTSHQPTTTSWAIAFEQAEKSSVLVLQHLLLGMNAHINLDLGIAAVEVCEGQPLANLSQDFDAINTIIAALTNQVLFELGQVSPLLSLLGLHASNANSALIQFSIGNARDGAWCFAESLIAQKPEDYAAFIATRDKTIHNLGNSIVDTSGFMRLTVWLIHLFEWKKPSRIIKALNEYQKKKIVVAK